MLRRQVCCHGGRQARDEQSVAHESADGHRAAGAVRARVGYFCGHVGRAVDTRTGRAQSRQQARPGELHDFLLIISFFLYLFMYLFIYFYLFSGEFHLWLPQERGCFTLSV